MTSSARRRSARLAVPAFVFAGAAVLGACTHHHPGPGPRPTITFPTTSVPGGPSTTAPGHEHGDAGGGKDHHGNPVTTTTPPTTAPGHEHGDAGGGLDHHGNPVVTTMPGHGHGH